MKKILYIFLTLSILTVGCSKEDDVQVVQETTTHLDENLIGLWKQSEYYTTSDYYRTFSSNGEYSHFRDDINDNYIDEQSQGTWYTEGNVLVTTGSTYFYYLYSNQDSLRIEDGDNHSYWGKQ